MFPYYNNKHNKVLLYLTDTSLYIYISLSFTYKKWYETILYKIFGSPVHLSGPVCVDILCPWGLAAGYVTGV